MAATISPYLRLLLSKRRPEELFPANEINDPVAEQPFDGPTISIRPRRSGMMPQPDPRAMPVDPGMTPPRSPDGDIYNRDSGFSPPPQSGPQVSALAQEPTIPITRPRTTQPANEPTIPIRRIPASSSLASQNPMMDPALDSDSRRQKIINAMEKSANLSPEGKDEIQAINAIGEEGKAGNPDVSSTLTPQGAPTISLRPRPVSVDAAASQESTPIRSDDEAFRKWQQEYAPDWPGKEVPFPTEASPQPDPTIALRPRRVAIDTAAQSPPSGDAFGASGQTFETSRPRRTQPRDLVADDAAYLRDLENQPRTKKDKFLDVVRIASQVGLGFDPGRLTNPRGAKIARARNRLATDLGVEQEQAQTRNYDAAAYGKLNKPPEGSTRIVGEGEYSDVPAGTEIRQTWNGSEMVDVLRNGKPVVSKATPAEKAAAREIKYNRKGEAVLVPKDGGRTIPVFNEDGSPLTRQANESGNVQVAYRLAEDGITQIQIERDGETGQWVDSVGRDKKPLVRGRVGKIDTATGAPVSTVITDNRLNTKERQENQRKRQSYEGEATEWGGKETAFRKNKSAEDSAIKTKTAQLQALYQEKPGGTLTNRGGRTQQQIETDKARLLKEIETHRTNATQFQTEADKAASSATEARRNAGLYTDSGGSQGVIGRAPAKDGKHHYTTAEIHAQAEAAGVSYESLYGKLKGNKRVVIDE